MIETVILRNDITNQSKEYQIVVWQHSPNLIFVCVLSTDTCKSKQKAHELHVTPCLTMRVLSFWFVNMHWSKLWCHTHTFYLLQWNHRLLFFTCSTEQNEFGQCITRNKKCIWQFTDDPGHQQLILSPLATEYKILSVELRSWSSAIRAYLHVHLCTLCNFQSVSHDHGSDNLSEWRF